MLRIPRDESKRWGLSADGLPEALPFGEHPAEAKFFSHSSTGKARGLLRRRIKESIQLIIESGIPHEFRTTLVKAFHSRQDLLEIRSLVNGARQYTLQRAMLDGKMLDKSLISQEPYSDAEFDLLRKEVASAAMEACV